MQYYGLELWNSLPNSVKSSQSVYEFKRLYKQYLWIIIIILHTYELTILYLYMYAYVTMLTLFVHMFHVFTLL